MLADPVGSTMGGGEHSDYDIEGIGNDFIPVTMDISLVDRVVKIENQTPAETAERIAAFVSWNNPFSTPIISFSEKK